MERFDTTKVSVVEGVVKRVQWVNPHVYIYIDQVTDDGSVVEWEVEGFPPAILRRQGWTKETLGSGDAITVTGNTHKKADVKSIFPQSIKRSDSSLFNMMAMMFKLNDVGGPPEIGANSLEGTWATLLSIEIMQKFMPGQMQLTEAGAKAYKSYDEDTMHPGIDCIKSAAPFSIFTPDTKRITLQEKTLNIAGDYDGNERVVRFDPSTLSTAKPSIQGHSIGRWEGKALVIETSHFASNAFGNGFGVPSGSQKRLIERVTLSEDGKSLHYYFELSDPEFLAAPITGDVEWVYRPNFTFAPEDCDLENARRFITN
jgi:hypothetical protein